MNDVDEYTAKRIQDAVFEDQALCDGCVYQRNVSEPYSIGDRTILAQEYDCIGTPEQCMDRVYHELQNWVISQAVKAARNV